MRYVLAWNIGFGAETGEVKTSDPSAVIAFKRIKVNVVNIVSADRNQLPKGILTRSFAFHQVGNHG